MDGLCVVGYQQKARGMYLGDVTEERQSLSPKRTEGGQGDAHPLWLLRLSQRDEPLLVSSCSLLYGCPCTGHKHGVLSLLRSKAS